MQGHCAGPLETGREPQPITADDSSLLGIGMSISLACGYVFRTAIGLPALQDRSASIWTLDVVDHQTGPGTCGPLDLGATWMIGAGAVGSALVWWLQYTGITGSWTIVDGDTVDETNLNRSLSYFAADAGLTGRPPTNKAIAAAALLPGATPFPGWWDAFADRNPTAPDVLIPVANDRGVRPAIAAYGHPAVLHATTSPNWSAELHRHLIDTDDCMACRLPEDAPRFPCATGTLGTSTDRESQNDAALPFLSGAAGLLLLGGLVQLQEGALPAHTANHWRWWFDDSAHGVSTTRWRCRASCAATPSSLVRRAVHGHTRWRHLDPSQGG